MFHLLGASSSSFVVIPRWIDELRLLLFFLFLRILRSSVCWLKDSLLDLSARSGSSEIDSGSQEMAIMELPELALDQILWKLSPAELRSMAGACSSLMEMCESDHLWERHMREKWGKVLGETARSELRRFLESKKANSSSRDKYGERRRWIERLLSSVWPFSWRRASAELDDGGVERCVSSPPDSVMNRYLALERGGFWFPAQIYNRENGHVGFLLSCYDAEISYDHHMDSFSARYIPHGNKPSVVEQGVKWDRIRAPPVDTPPFELHASTRLDDLRPGDHFEIQWRKNKEFPYGWWYGVVGHLESCDGDERYCRCHSSDTIILEFNQFSSGSRWRHKTINRKDHREEGDEIDGFYGGLRKLHDGDDVSEWRRFWPTHAL